MRSERLSDIVECNAHSLNFYLIGLYFQYCFSKHAPYSEHFHFHCGTKSKGRILSNDFDPSKIEERKWGPKLRAELENEDFLEFWGGAMATSSL